MNANSRLRIAVQKSGRLAEPSRMMLSRLGLMFREDRDSLYASCSAMPVDLLRVRDDDIPGLLGDGSCDLGIVGRNVFLELAPPISEAPDSLRLTELRPLGYGSCRLALAMPEEQAFMGLSSLAGRRIATSYPKLLEAYLTQQGIAAKVVVLSGSVEIAPRMGSADLICDLVSSGATLAANRLREVATVLDSEAVLVGPASLPSGRCGEVMKLLLSRLDSVLAGRDLRVLLMELPRAALAEVTRLLPGKEPPTLLRAAGRSNRITLQARCNGEPSWQCLEALQRAGATALMVLPIERVLA